MFRFKSLLEELDLHKNFENTNSALIPMCIKWGGECSSSFSVLFYFNNIYIFLCWLKFVLLFARPAGILLRPRTVQSQTCEKVLAMFVLNFRLYLFCI